MFGDEAELWRRFLAVDQIRQFQEQLAATPQAKQFSLNLNGYNLEECEAQSLSDSIRQKERHHKGNAIESLSLEQIECSQESWQLLEGCLLGLASLQKLFLRKVVIRPWDPQEDAENNDENTFLARSLAKIIENKKNLKEIHMVRSGISSQGAQIVSRAISKSSTITTVSLEGNPIGNTGLKCLVEICLESSPIKNEKVSARSRTRGCLLQTLSLESVGVSDSGVIPLIESLRSNTTLRSLNLMGNAPISAKVLSLLNEILCESNFDLGYFAVTPTRGWETVRQGQRANEEAKVQFWLRLNRMKRRKILQEGSGVSSEILWWPWLLERVATDPEILYYCLRSKPTVFGGS